MTWLERAFAAEGGLDLVSAPNLTPPGRLIGCVNYESGERGYRRIDGFERYDGRPKPSDATYYILDFDAGSAAISEGDIVTGQTSGATAEALIDAVVETGSYGGADATGYLVLLNITGTFQDDENLQVSAATKSVADGTPRLRDADTDELDETYWQDAIETTRTDIQAVTGSGAIRGVWSYEGNTYAFRDNAGATACIMWKASTSGWTQVDLGVEIDFTSGGTYEIAEADTITGAISGATATVERVILVSGTWAGGDAAGRLILSGQVGTFQAENLDVGGNLNVATIASDTTAITLLPGGRYEFINFNFYGASDLNRMYGCDGVNPGFEFDGTAFVQIDTGMTTDTPTHLAAHKYHLFFAFAGGSVQHSAIGDPYDWSPVLGASEIAMGQEVTGFLADTQGLLSIFCRNKIGLLYGNDVSDWNLDTLSNDAGAVEWTLQKIGLGLYVDDYGIRSLNPTDKFGDFAIGSLSSMVTPIFSQYRKDGVTPIASVRVRSRAQYRLYWSNGIVLTMDFRKRAPEATLQSLGKTVNCVCSAEDSSGNEVIFFGSTDGYVYQMDKGLSFDGSAIEHFIRFAFFNAGTPMNKKRWRRVFVETDPGTQATLQVSALYDYGSDDYPGSPEIAFTLQGGGGNWDEAFWDDFSWSSPFAQRCHAGLNGRGPNIAIGIYGSQTYQEPHTIHSVTLHFGELRQAREAL